MDLPTLVMLRLDLPQTVLSMVPVQGEYSMCSVVWCKWKGKTYSLKYFVFFSLVLFITTEWQHSFMWCVEKKVFFFFLPQVSWLRNLLLYFLFRNQFVILLVVWRGLRAQHLVEHAVQIETQFWYLCRMCPILKTRLLFLTMYQNNLEKLEAKGSADTPSLKSPLAHQSSSSV